MTDFALLESGLKNIHAKMFEDILTVLARSGSGRMKKDIVPPVTSYLSRISPMYRLSHGNEGSLSLNKAIMPHGGFSLGDQDYAELEEIVSGSRKAALLLLRDYIRHPDTDSMHPEKVYLDYSLADDLFKELLSGFVRAHSDFLDDTNIYQNRFAGVHLDTDTGLLLSVLVEDDTIPFHMESSQQFNDYLEKLGDYASVLLKTKPRKPISAVILRVSPDETDRIMKSFGNPCISGRMNLECEEISDSAGAFLMKKDDSFLMEIREIIYDAHDECGLDCRALSEMNAITYFLLNPFVAGFYDHQFPDIINVFKYTEDCGRMMFGVDESDVNDLHTAVHEYLHFCSTKEDEYCGLIDYEVSYSSAEMMLASTCLNEGMTEYLSIECMDRVMNAKEYASGRSYPHQVAVASELVKLLGIGFMIDCYTSGGIVRLGAMVNQVIGTDEMPDPWSEIISDAAVLHGVMSGYVKNDDGSPLTYDQRMRLMTECRDRIIKTLRKGGRS